MPVTEPANRSASLQDVVRARRAIVVVDVVESVRLMQQDEAGFIGCWRHFVHGVRAEVLPTHGGQLVKSLGDGLLLVFERSAQAAAAAQAMHRLGASIAAARARTLALRVGIHAAEITQDDLDIYGTGVNLAARLAGVADAGTTVMSVEAREELVDGLRFDLVDLGPLYMKHIDQPVRVFRLLDDAPARLLPRPAAVVPRIAVLPLQSDAAGSALARVLTDDLVATLAAVPHWMVMSRLSTAALAAQGGDAAASSASLDADYWVVGTLFGDSPALGLRLALQESQGAIVWEGVVSSRAVKDMHALHEALVVEACSQLVGQILARQLSLSQAALLPSVPSYGLLLGAVMLLHRLGGGDFERALALLEHLVQRNPRSPEAHAWLAKWLFLQIAQRRTADTAAAVRRADQHLDRALQADPRHALSMALAGHLQVFAKADRAAALRQLREAVAVGSNEPLAWLFLSNALAAEGDGDAAVQAADHACALSPIDPLGYYYDTFASNAYSAAGRHTHALALAQRAVRRNRLHLAGWVRLIIEQVFNHQMDDARASAAEYLAMRPAASVQRFIDTHIAAGTHRALRDAEALIAAGIPR